MKKSRDSDTLVLSDVAQTVTQSESTMPKYTELRGTVFWFKRRVPKYIVAGTDLNLDGQKATVGKTGTSDFRYARQMCVKQIV